MDCFAIRENLVLPTQKSVVEGFDLLAERGGGAENLLLLPASITEALYPYRGSAGWLRQRFLRDAPSLKRKRP